MAHPHLTLRPGHPDPSTATHAEAVRPAAAPALVEAFEAIRAEHEIPAEFPPEVLAEAAEVAGTDVLPERDERAVEFITIDPEGSMDLDQAMHIEREGDGFLVRYAIADVPALSLIHISEPTRRS